MQHWRGIALSTSVFCGCALACSTDASTAEELPGKGAADASTDGTGETTAAPNTAVPPKPEGGAARPDSGTPSNEPTTHDAGGTSKPALEPDAADAVLTDAATEKELCESLAPLVPGQNYGPFSLFALRVDPELEPGTYVIASPPETTGVVNVYTNDVLLGEFTYDADASLQNGMEQTVAFPHLFELDLRSQTEPDLRTLGDHPFDGCHAVIVEVASTVQSGGQYGAFLVSELSVDPLAPGGEYTFYTPSGNSGSVDLLRDGLTVYTLEYQWQSTIGGGESYSFIFPEILTMTVTRAAGTSNLFGLATDLFDGRHVLLVP